MTHRRRTLACALVLGTATLVPQLAQAAWTDLPILPGFTAYVSSARVCKVAVSSVYGPLWYVNYQVFRRDTRAVSILTYSIRMPQGVPNNIQKNDQWMYNWVAGTGRNVYASPFFDDQFVFQVDFSPAVYNTVRGGYYGGIGLGMLKPSQIANC